MLVLSSAGLLYLLNEAFLVTVPSHGGTVTEGIIGTPRFINPVLAITDADRDLTTLVYSGLLRATPDGGFAPNLADHYSISEDGRTYSVVLRADSIFHDGTPVTADDVIFTVKKIQDPSLKSPAYANWDGVEVIKTDDRTVVFTLKSAYAPFIKNLTLGILPAHLWGEVSNSEFPFSNLNTYPIGSGPFKVATVTRTSGGIPSSYELEPFSRYLSGAPYLSRMTLQFYQNESDLLSALERGDIDAAASLSPEKLGLIGSLRVEKAPLNRVFGVFLNQNQAEVLRDSTVRKALGDAIDRDDLVHQVLGGYGTPLSGPVPSGTRSETASEPTPDRITEARSALVRAGWKENTEGYFEKTTGAGKEAKTVPLAFSITTGNITELRAAAQYLADTWKRLGVRVEVKVFDQGDLSQNVIRPRKYDALLFGEVVGRELDLFAFWHSSQRNDPGLNIALYANSTADEVLEKLRSTEDKQARDELYATFEALIRKDNPAIFLYTPDFVYTVPQGLRGLTLGFIETQSDRFLSVADWYTKTDRVWPLFARVR